jgi:hypothetical protein
VSATAIAIVERLIVQAKLTGACGCIFDLALMLYQKYGWRFRGKRGHGGREVFPAPLSQLEYAENYAAVDRNDRESSDWTTSMRTNRYYFCIKFWL